MKNLVNRNLDEFLFETSMAKKRVAKGDQRFKKVMKYRKEGKQHIGKTDKIVPNTKGG